MKVLCVADHVDPLVYSPGVKERFPGVELVLSAGDLPVSYYEFLMSSLNKPLLFVFGNHNLRYLDVYKGRLDGLVRAAPWQGERYDRLPGCTYVGVQVRREKSVLVAGLGGARWYNGEENQFSELQTALRIGRLLPALLWNRLRYGRYLDILLTHSPPFGIHDGPDPAHVGFKVFLWFMRTFKPRYLVHGHVHVYSSDEARRTRYHRTMVVNAYNHQVIELEVEE